MHSTGFMSRAWARKVVDHDPTVLRVEMGTYELRAARLQPVPDDEPLVGDRGLQGLEELDDLRASDRAVE